MRSEDARVGMKVVLDTSHYMLPSWFQNIEVYAVLKKITDESGIITIIDGTTRKIPLRFLNEVDEETWRSNLFKLSNSIEELL